jgi:hypothetical protein
VAKDLIQSKSGKETNVDTEKREEEKRSKLNYFVGTVVATVSTVTQMTVGFSA